MKTIARQGECLVDALVCLRHAGFMNYFDDFAMYGLKYVQNLLVGEKYIQSMVFCLFQELNIDPVEVENLLVSCILDK